MRLKDKVAVVTGAGSGIGRASALRFAQEGARVVVDWKPEGGRETVARIKAQGGEAIFVEADVSREEDVRRAIETAVNTYGGGCTFCSTMRPSKCSAPCRTPRRRIGTGSWM